MLIKEQRGKTCPDHPTIRVGSIGCVECDHWKLKRSACINRDKDGNPYLDSRGEPMTGSDQWCALLKEDEEQ